MARGMACIFFLLGALGQLHGNNLRLTNPGMRTPQLLEVTLSWENSWYLPNSDSPGNHDAVWLFAKVLTPSGWQHLLLNNAADHHQSSQANMGIYPTQDGIGAFLRRQQQGSGPIEALQITLALASTLPEDAIALQIFGIEMVFVPEGAFWVGDTASQFSLSDGNSRQPFFINQSGALPVGAESGQLNSLAGEKIPSSEIPGLFPKGYESFYCMKYEISQEQFTDFLNTLSYAQQARLLPVSPDAPSGTFIYAGGATSLPFRNGLSIGNPGQNPGIPATIVCNADSQLPLNGQADAQTRACNFLGWTALTAYLDWAGLRPMSELEFEKVSRGFLRPLPKEFAWGTSTYTNANTPLEDGTTAETSEERPLPQSGLANAGGQPGNGFLQGPFRTGFAANAETDRTAAGSSYFGAMEMSGNLWELVVSILGDGLRFTGTTGDGILSEEGLANQPDWPNPETGQGAGHRGGAWNSLIFNDPDYEFRDLAISDRFYIDLPPAGRNTTGGRGVRQP